MQQIVDLKTSIVKDEKGLNVFLEKEAELRRKLNEIESVTKENYEETKALKQEIISSKTGVDKVRKQIKAPVIELGRAIDERAIELQTPFADMQVEIQNKLDVYEAEEQRKKEEEQKRIDNIISGINNSESIAALLEYHKSLDSNDQKRKAILEAFTLKKDRIIEAQNKAEIEEFTRLIKSAETLNALEEIKKAIDESKHITNEELYEAISTRKSQITLKIEQDKLREEREAARIEQERIDKEREEADRIAREAQEAKEKELEAEREQMRIEKQKMFEEKCEITKSKIEGLKTIEELNNFMNSLIEDDDLHNAVHETYENCLSKLSKVTETIKPTQEEEKEILDEPETTEEQVESTMSVGDMIKKWIFDNHFHISQDDFTQDGLPDELREETDMPVVNSLELEKFIDTLGL